MRPGPNPSLLCIYFTHTLKQLSCHISQRLVRKSATFTKIVQMVLPSGWSTLSPIRQPSYAFIVSICIPFTLLIFTPYPPVEMKKDGVLELKKPMSGREIIVYKIVRPTFAVYLSPRHRRVRYVHICPKFQVSATLHCEFET